MLVNDSVSARVKARHTLMVFEGASMAFPTDVAAMSVTIESCCCSGTVSTNGSIDSETGAGAGTASEEDEADAATWAGVWNG